MTSDENQIQILAHWPMSHAKRVTRDNRKNPEYHVAAAISKTADRHKLPRKKKTAFSLAENKFEIMVFTATSFDFSSSTFCDSQVKVLQDRQEPFPNFNNLHLRSVRTATISCQYSPVRPSCSVSKRLI